MTLNDVIGYIRLVFKDRTSAAEPRVTNALMRQALETLAGYAMAPDFMTPKQLNTPNLNDGLRLNTPFAIGRFGDATHRYMRVAKLMPGDANLRDTIRIEVSMGAFTASRRGSLDLVLGNRDGLTGFYDQRGDLAGCGVVAYGQADGSTLIYLKIANDDRAGTVSVTHNVQATVYDSWDETNPAGSVPGGTLLYDTTNTTAYPPQLILTQSLCQVPGFLATGAGNKPFQITDQKTGSSLSVSTTKYVEMNQADGTTIKLAVLN